MDLARRILANHEDARNSDRKLFYYAIMTDLTNKGKVNDIPTMENFLEEIFINGPDLEQLSRCRRKLQADGFFPSTEEVRRWRLRRFEEYVKEFGDKTE